MDRAEEREFRHKLNAIIKADEGFSRTPYQDTEGVWTIGYGTNITEISREEAEILLDLRLSKVIRWDLGNLDPVEVGE